MHNVTSETVVGGGLVLFLVGSILRLIACIAWGL